MTPSDLVDVTTFRGDMFFPYTASRPRQLQSLLQSNQNYEFATGVCATLPFPPTFLPLSP